MDRAGREAGGQLNSYSYGTKGERSIVDVLRDIANSIQEIVRSEIRLARVELTEEGKKVSVGAKALAVGAVAGLYGLGFVLLAAMFALELILPSWAAAIIVGFVLLVVAGVGATTGIRRIKEFKAPAKTIATVKEDAKWIQEQPKS